MNLSICMQTDFTAIIILPNLIVYLLVIISFWSVNYNSLRDKKLQ